MMVDIPGEEVDLGQVEQGVVDVDALLAELDELIGVALVDLLWAQEAQTVAGRQDVAKPVHWREDKRLGQKIEFHWRVKNGDGGARATPTTHKARYL